MNGEEPNAESPGLRPARTVASGTALQTSDGGVGVLLIEAPGAGVRPMPAPAARVCAVTSESGCLGMQPKAGGKLHLRLNTGTRPIADKYLEGKLKRTLKREFNST